MIEMTDEDEAVLEAEALAIGIRGHRPGLRLWALRVIGCDPAAVVAEASAIRARRAAEQKAA